MSTWGFSAIDRRWHVIAQEFGVFRATCGRLLPTGAPLHDEFHGRWCEVCAAQQLVTVPTPEFSRDRLFPSPSPPPVWMLMCRLWGSTQSPAGGGLQTGENRPPQRWGSLPSGN